MDEETSNIYLQRNLLGIEFEKLNEIEEAVNLYERNISDNCEGSHPYNRLAIIYRKFKLYEDEKRVLEKAVYVFENLVDEKRADRIPKLEKFKERLEKVYKLIERRKEETK